MQNTVDFLDITPFTAKMVIPETAVPLKLGQLWYARRQPINFLEPPPKRDSSQFTEDFAFVRKGDLIKIPLCPYRTNSQDLSQLVAVAMDTAIRDAHLFPNAIRCHIVVGTPLEILPDNAYRYWVGVAFQEK
mgnify:CR=1 FL=1